MMFAGGANERDLSRREVLQGVVGIGVLSGVTGTATAAGPGEQIWQFETDGDVVSSPTVVDGTVYVGSNDGNLYAIDVGSGEQQWQFETGDWVYSSPTVVDGTVYVGSRDGSLYAIDAGSGEQQWQFETGDTVLSSPTVVDGTVYVGSYDNSLYAVKAATGEQQWQFETGDWVYSSPTVVDGTVYVGSFDGNLYAVETETPTATSTPTPGEPPGSPPTSQTPVSGTGGGYPTPEPPTSPPPTPVSGTGGTQTQTRGDGLQQWLPLVGAGVLGGVTLLGVLLYRGGEDDESTAEDSQLSRDQLLNNASRSYHAAELARNKANYQTALAEFNTAIDRYTTAKTQLPDNDTKQDHIAQRLEIARTAVTEITERQEFRESLAESVESAESCLQTALTAQADGDIVGARTRYRQARAQYDQALSELDGAEADPSEWGPVVVSRDTQIATPPSDPTAVAEVGDGKSLEELAIDSQEAFEQTDTTALAPVLEMVATAWWEDETETSIQGRETIEEWRDIAAEQEETLR